jgi:ATP-binding cassette, subfamily B, bacterial MsbA
MNGYLRVLGYLRPHLGLFAVSVVAMVAFAALDVFSFALLIPFLQVLFSGGDVESIGAFFADGDNAIRRLLEWVVGDLVADATPMQALWNVVSILFVVFLLKNGALYVQQLTVGVVQSRVTRDLRNHIYQHLLGLGFPFFQRTRVGQVISRVTVDVDQVRMLVAANLAKALSSAIQVVFLLTALMMLSWRLTLVTLLFLPPMLGLWGHLRHRLRRGVLRVLDAVGEVSAHIQETISGIRLVKASGAERWEERRFRELTRSHYKASVRDERWRQFFPPATEMITAVAVLGMVWYGSWLVLVDGSLAAEEFLLALVYAMKLMSPAKWLGNFPSTIQPGLAAAERAFHLLDTPPEIVSRSGAEPVQGLRDRVRLEGVTFSYGEEPVLRDIDLDIGAGEVVALVGPSGAGKSTLADLLPRFHDVTGGRITVDGRDIRDLRLTDLRSLFGIVTQETILFNDTVRNNIAYGLEDVPEERVREAARAAYADEFIEALPEGYETVLGERGVRLSGGQRQRIAIARALLRNPPFLILDEATSALDTASERAVQAAIEQLLEGRTVLVIAHRLSTVRRADRIVALEAGRIVEQGRHDELLARDGLYRRLHAMQFASDQQAPATALAEPA